MHCQQIMATHIPLTPPGAASGLLVRPNPPDRAVAADLPPCGAPHKLPAESKRISGEAAISMIVDHVSITVNDMARSAPFYDAIMAALGVPCVWREDEAVGYGFRNGPDDDGRSYMTVRKSAGIVKADNRHWCFAARERSAVDAFHAAGIASGGRCDGPPGPRPDYHEAYYAAFLLDPDGNRIEAVCHRR
jgi:catechol 2,3-dioxygenase-like lactoylglutathione lyase family enzyme